MSLSSEQVTLFVSVVVYCYAVFSHCFSRWPTLKVDSGRSPSGGQATQHSDMTRTEFIYTMMFYRDF